MGYLKRVGTKRYRYTYEGPRVNGKRQQLTGTFYDLTRTEAEAKLAKLVAEARNGQHVTTPNLTLKQMLNEFMEKKKLTLAVSTCERYAMLARLYIIPKLGDIKVRDMRQSDLVKAYSKLLVNGSGEKPVSGRTVRHAHDLIRCVLNFGLRHDLVTRNVAALIPTEDLPKAPKPEPNALSEEEIRRLLEAARTPSGRSFKRSYLTAEPWFAPAVAFSIYTGARRGETLAIRWSDLNLVAKSVAIRRSLADTKTAGCFFKDPKNGKARTIALPAPLVSILERHRSAQGREREALGKSYQENDLVFARPDGALVTPWCYTAAVKRLAKRAKVKSFSLHDLRDTHASLLAKNGVPLEVVSKRLGHSSIGVTAERYLHVYSDRDAAAASALDALGG